MTRKVAIVGLADTSAHAPWTEVDWEVWGLNGGHVRTFLRPTGFGKVALRANAWFQIHPPECCDHTELDWMDRLGREFHIQTYVRPQDVPLWVKRNSDSSPFLTPYPIDKIRRMFPHGWFANTFCLEMALAIYMGATAIGLYGIDCGSYGREIAVERPAISYWRGVCDANGITVTMPEPNVYHYDHVYGFDYWEEARRAAEITELLLPTTQSSDEVNLDTIAAVDAAEDRVHAR